jgi:hypothetical protein
VVWVGYSEIKRHLVHSFVKQMGQHGFRARENYALEGSTALADAADASLVGRHSRPVA